MTSFVSSNPFGIGDPSAQSARRPRAIVMLNDMKVKFSELHLTTTTFYLADSFRVELPLNSQMGALNFNYLASTDKFSMKFYIGFPADPNFYSTSDLDLLLEGDADNMEFDPAEFKVTFSGRDYTSKFIDNKTTEKFSNQTASQVVEMFAQKNNLKTKVTSTSTPVGTYYSQQQVLLSSEISQWDLMTYLAQQEDFALFVQGDTLVFEPRPSDTNAQDPFIIKYQPAIPVISSSPNINTMSLTLSRSMTIAQSAQVTVRVPYGTKTGKAFSVTAKSQKKGGSGGSSGSGVQKYSFTKAGLTQEQASQFAQQRLKEITSHEVRLHATMPGNNKLRKDSLIQLIGTGSSFDQYYYSDQVTRNFSFAAGYVMDVSAKNHSVDSEVSPP